MARAAFVSQLIGLQRATHSKNEVNLSSLGMEKKETRKTADIETNSPSSV